MTEYATVAVVFDEPLDGKVMLTLLEYCAGQAEGGDGSRSERSLEEDVSGQLADDFHVTTFEYGDLVVQVIAEGEHFDVLQGVPHVVLSAPDRPLKSRGSDYDVAAAEDNSRTFVDLVAGLYEELVGAGVAVPYVVGIGPTEFGLLGDEFELPEAQVRGETLVDVFWLQVLRPSLVEELGREAVLDAPGHEVRELDDGAVLLTLYSTPTPWNTGEPDVDLVWETVSEHLDLPYEPQSGSAAPQ